MSENEMLNILFKNKNNIGFLLTGCLTGNEFVHVIHQIELLCRENDFVNVLLDTDKIESHDFKLHLRDFDLFKKYQSRIKKIALIHGEGKDLFINRQFMGFANKEIRVFGNEQTENAEKWISV